MRGALGLTDSVCVLAARDRLGKIVVCRFLEFGGAAGFGGPRAIVSPVHRFFKLAQEIAIRLGFLGEETARRRRYDQRCYFCRVHKLTHKLARHRKQTAGQKREALLIH